MAFTILPTFSQTFNADNFAELKAAITAAIAPHTININCDIKFSSVMAKALNLEFLGSSNIPNFDLNGFAFTFLGTDKNVKFSNLNIVETLPYSGIISRNKTLTIEKSTLSGHVKFGRELVKNSDGALIVSGSKFLNNYAPNGAGIYSDGTTVSISDSEFSGNKVFYGGTIY